MSPRDRRLFFFIGTTAELIKLMPVMEACRSHGLPFEVIASGQNDIRDSELLAFSGASKVDIALHRGPIRKSAVGLLVWFIKTLTASAWRLRSFLPPRTVGRPFMLVHGDTVSTVMGAMLAKLYGMRVGHIEAGLRSFDYFHPFPEEIDRVLTSRMTDVHFCPNAWAVGNIRSRSGLKVDTRHNTLLDALSMARRAAQPSQTLRNLAGKRYFVFVMHRQENLFNEGLVKTMVGKVIEQSRRDHCLFVVHHTTAVALEQLGLMAELRRQPGITLAPRLPYMEFMQVLARSHYVITDGGSNQEECYYLGLPCLLLRKVTERTEGLDENVVLSRLEPAAIEAFLQEPQKWRREPVHADHSPSDMIVETLAKLLADEKAAHP